MENENKVRKYIVELSLEEINMIKESCELHYELLLKKFTSIPDKAFLKKDDLQNAMLLAETVAQYDDYIISQSYRKHKRAVLQDIVNGFEWNRKKLTKKRNQPEPPKPETHSQYPLLTIQKKKVIFNG